FFVHVLNLPMRHAGVSPLSLHLILYRRTIAFLPVLSVTSSPGLQDRWTVCPRPVRFRRHQYESVGCGSRLCLHTSILILTRSLEYLASLVTFLMQKSVRANVSTVRTPKFSGRRSLQTISIR